MVSRTFLILVVVARRESRTTQKHMCDDALLAVKIVYFARPFHVSIVLDDDPLKRRVLSGISRFDVLRKFAKCRGQIISRATFLSRTFCRFFGARRTLMPPWPKRSKPLVVGQLAQASLYRIESFKLMRTFASFVLELEGGRV